MKILIFGNCGCGKSYLAHQLSLLTNIKAVNLDAIMWVPGTDLFRDNADIYNDLDNCINMDNYIIEGVWGNIMEYLIANDKIDLLVFVEIDINECARNIMERISDEENGMIPIEERLKIIKYARNYYIENLTVDNIDNILELNLHKQFNLKYHQKIFDEFIIGYVVSSQNTEQPNQPNKVYLHNRNECNVFVNGFLEMYIS